MVIYFWVLWFFSNHVLCRSFNWKVFGVAGLGYPCLLLQKMHAIDPKALQCKILNLLQSSYSRSASISTPILHNGLHRFSGESFVDALKMIIYHRNCDLSTWRSISSIHSSLRILFFTQLLMTTDKNINKHSFESRI